VVRCSPAASPAGAGGSASWPDAARCGRLDVWGVCGEWRPTERGDAVSSGDKRRRSAVTHTTPAAGRSRSPTRGNRNEWVDGERELR
jgi:hypothetical protein